MEDLFKGSCRVKGLYVLLIALLEARTITIGSLGPLSFAKGCYGYIGSALGGLRGRIARHLRKDKVKRWHIDYLLEHAEVKEVLTLEALGEGKGWECLIAERVGHELQRIAHFGSSDCRCGGHLFFSPSMGPLREAFFKAMAALSRQENSFRGPFLWQVVEGTLKAPRG